MYIWEIFVCLLESIFITYLFYKKIGVKPTRKNRVFFSILLMTGILSALTLLKVSLFWKMSTMLLVFMLIAFWTFDCSEKGRRFKIILWASSPLILVTVADFVSYTIALAVLGDQLTNLEIFGGLRMQFTLIYLLLVALMVWLLTHLGETDSELPFSFGLILFSFVSIGIFAVESMIDITLALQKNPNTATQAHTISLLGYCILFMLFASLILFEYLGVVLRHNRELKQQRQLAMIEEQQYQFMLSTAESLSEWKHDYQGQLRLMSALIEEKNYTELQQFIHGVDAALSASASVIFTGNRTIDAVISLRMMDAKRHQISFETKLYLPEELPLHEVAFSSLIGNMLDNAVEACLKVPTDAKNIFFEMKPWKKMLYIFCSNTSDGNYIKGSKDTLLTTKKTRGHGIGLRRIREIVEEAGGTCQFSPQANQFSVSVMIPLKENES